MTISPNLVSYEESPSNFNFINNQTGSQSNISVSNTRSDSSESATLRIGDQPKETDFPQVGLENLR